MVLKPSADTRDGYGIIKSRIGLERECVMVDSTVDVYKAVDKYNSITMSTFGKLEWILVDECQFLSEVQIDQLAKIVDKLDINVMCFGLRTDFTSHCFPASRRLFELSDHIEEIKSSCTCGKKTSINARFDENGKLLLNGNQIMIGDEKYKPLCRKCWFEKIRQLEKENNI